MMKIALAQINPTVGDIKSNTKKIVNTLLKAQQESVSLVVFPELVVTGYPPKDLLLKKSFVSFNKEALREIVSHTQKTAAIVGFVDEKEGLLYNAAAIIEEGMIKGIYHKQHLPNYDVFDEKRYFTSGTSSSVFKIGSMNIGVTICEDIWVENNPLLNLKKQGAELIINISGSPFHAGKRTVRENLLRKRTEEINLPLIYLNIIGGQDDLIFDGRSYVYSRKGELLARAKSFEEDFLIIDNFEKKARIETAQGLIEEIYNALILGIHDYVQKNGFKQVIIGLSGGIDSAITAALAVKALGADKVEGITMPSEFSSIGSVQDSLQLAKNLSIKCHTITIKDIYQNYIKALSVQFENTHFNVAEENVQARIRGNLLMAVSNKFGHLVLTTGNKSELSVGYATLYGDMSGGLAVISDLFKTKVYELAHFINQRERQEIIPPAIIEKEPSAELRFDQKDSDSLPPYPILDPILQAYVEEDKSAEEIITLGFDPEVVKKVIKMVDRSEYKRNQAAPGIRVTPRAFGSGRRIPITNGWVE